MVPFHLNGLVLSSCSVATKKWNGMVPLCVRLRQICGMERLDFGSAHLFDMIGEITCHMCNYSIVKLWQNIINFSATFRLYFQQ
jgi:hypothetical protein